ncbi:hypothetical protein GALMADRAFT_835908 [Galerina marginata CBS 339.88]|uniref:Uncharacterized protein n=1 Tax=Galerina marginata (strain CBS 339.88) TaxID=685588 RepID=A0A067TUH1_GALM3|nr:hypothetical protein GALMADRAFT_835908 [Galerina marginata CBS 339.88]
MQSSKLSGTKPGLEVTIPRMRCRKPLSFWYPPPYENWFGGQVSMLRTRVTAGTHELFLTKVLFQWSDYYSTTLGMASLSTQLREARRSPKQTSKATLNSFSLPTENVLPRRNGRTFRTTGFFFQAYLASEDEFKGTAEGRDGQSGIPAKATRSVFRFSECSPRQRICPCPMPLPLPARLPDTHEPQSTNNRATLPSSRSPFRVHPFPVCLCLCLFSLEALPA